jgi:hypothetical protein
MRHPKEEGNESHSRDGMGMSYYDLVRTSAVLKTHEDAKTYNDQIRSQ